VDFEQVLRRPIETAPFIRRNPLRARRALEIKHGPDEGVSSGPGWYVD
jgi:hypothetical protein